jgi:hypothetical protein
VFTKNVGVLAIAFVAEICTSGGSSLLTLCVHEDGSVRYEPTLALCCKPTDAGKGECCSHEEGKSGERDGIEEDDACQDYAVLFSQVVPSKPSIRQYLLDGPAHFEWLPIIAVLLETPFARESAAFENCGPPQDRILHELSTIVLRI